MYTLVEGILLCLKGLSERPTCIYRIYRIDSNCADLFIAYSNKKHVLMQFHQDRSKIERIVCVAIINGGIDILKEYTCLGFEKLGFTLETSYKQMRQPQK